MTANTTARRPAAALAEAVVVGEFWANRGGESVRVQLCRIEGVRCVDIRRHQTVAGKLQPTHKGIALTIHKLPALAAAIAKALHKARELNLIDREGHDHD
jgi:Transcriptional Coactivator p15 (PC4)